MANEILIKEKMYAVHSLSEICLFYYVYFLQIYYFAFRSHSPRFFITYYVINIYANMLINILLLYYELVKSTKEKTFFDIYNWRH